MNKKKFLTSILLLLGLTFALHAQRTPFGVPNLLRYDEKIFHFGFQIGLTQSDFSIRSKANLAEYDSLMVINTSALSGFNLGIVTNLRLGKYFDLRFIPGISFGDRNVNYTIKYSTGKEIVTKKNIESVYMDLPLLLKFKSSRMHNVRVYVLAGAQYSLDLISAAKKEAANPKEIFLKVFPHDFQGQAGVGFDFYLANFKFTTELKMSFGFINLLKQEDNMYASSIQSLKSKNLIISFFIE
ncbi:PorT family protein [Bacteroidales bacterium OttesenSCG-928-B11]|nr:PorT family protein [Bacteroidales bacterium OttesenSCG-928-C03]MDL2312388.1 PorT family protein [Bacteroidales bacterium OttesenSCG-928-B11]MDL2326644.1 PorT family protein [Bacteroidales bacterium OttesenSCG-928-A14]